MVVDELVSDARTDRLFHALADPTRRRIVSLGLTGEHSVSDLARRFPMSFAAVQKHVAVLEQAGLVVKQRSGREVRVRTDPAALDETRRLLDVLAGGLRARLGQIDDVLADDIQKHEDTQQHQDTEGQETHP